MLPTALRNRFAAVALHPFERCEGAVICALGFGAVPHVAAEARLLLLELCLGDTGESAAVVASEPLPELVIDAAGTPQFPARLDELVYDDAFVGVGGPMDLEEVGAQCLVLGGTAVGIKFGGHRNPSTTTCNMRPSSDRSMETP